MDSLLKKWRLRRIASWADRTPESVESDIKSLVLDQVNREPGISWAHTIPKPKNMDAYVDKLTERQIGKVYHTLYRDVTIWQGKHEEARKAIAELIADQGVTKCS